VRLLSFLARRFAWQPHERTLEGGDAAPPAGEALECVVVFVHAEARDAEPERWKSTLDHARKHVEWLARKRAARAVVLHSFAHLGGTGGDAQDGQRWIEELGAKLAARGFSVQRTPFGWTNAWQLDAHGEAIAKVWKEL
jgi:hypothetical protein